MWNSRLDHFDAGRQKAGFAVKPFGVLLRMQEHLCERGVLGMFDCGVE